MNLRDLWLRLFALARRARVERELAEELDFHIAMQTRKNVAAGMTELEAARAARLQFGARAAAEEQCRDERRVRLIETLWQDIRYAVRGFLRTPVFAATVIMTIAIGLGLNTTVFTIFNAYVLRPAAVRDPYSLYEFAWTNRDGRGQFMSWPQVQDFKKWDPVFSETCAHRFLFARFDGAPFFGLLVEGNYFRMLGGAPALGRVLTEADSKAPGGERVAVLSYTAWKTRFAADPNIVGRRIVIHSQPLEIVGVTRDGFLGAGDTPPDFWAPLTMAPALLDGPSLFGPDHPALVRMLARLKPGVTPDRAVAALTTWSKRITSGLPDKDKANGILMESQATAIPLSPRVLLAFSPLLGAFALVLLLACANVANMMLARAMARQREIGIRLSLGAGRGRLIRQLLTESFLLAAPAAGAAFVISRATIDSGERLMFKTLPSEFAEYIRVVPLPPDARVFIFMLLAAIAAAVLFGLAPALQATRTGIVQAARGDFSADFRPARLRNTLVAGQITVCVLLLVSAGILLRGSVALQNVDPGLNTRDTIAIEIQDQFRERVLTVLHSDPGIVRLAAAAKVPIDGAPPWVPVVIAGAAPRSLMAAFNYVSPEFFQLFDIPIVRGRSFTTAEAEDAAPVAVISQATANLFWPGQDPLGKEIRIAIEAQRHGKDRGRAAGNMHRQVRVIGVARDAISAWIGNGPDKTLMYFPDSIHGAGNFLMARVKGDAEAARRRIDAELARVDPSAVLQLHKMREYIAVEVYPFRAAYWVSCAIGVLALLLTLSGIYGVLSYLVAQRTKEIGIRMAIGASSRSIVGLVVAQSLKLAAVGVGIGTILALGVSRLFASFLFMMNTFDVGAYALGIALVSAAAFIASYVPSRRACRIDPISTLRYD